MKRQGREKTKSSSLSPISKSAIKSLLRSTVNKDIQISKGAIDTLRDVLTEHGKWISIEAERIARYAGHGRITEEEIREAVEVYFKSLKKG